MQQSDFSVGDIVRVKRSFIGEPEGVLGYVYELYRDFDDLNKKGISIITENGKDLGGFSHREQGEYLDYVRSSGIGYEFKGLIRLKSDFDSGLFSWIFEAAK